MPSLPGLSHIPFRRELHSSQVFRLAGDDASKPPEDTPAKLRQEIYSEIARALPGVLAEALARHPVISEFVRALPIAAEALARVPGLGHAAGAAPGPGTVLTLLTLTPVFSTRM